MNNLSKVFQRAIILIPTLTIIVVCVGVLLIYTAGFISATNRQNVASQGAPSLSPAEVQIEEYCATQITDFISVLQFSELPQVKIYTWNYADDGYEREIRYYRALCSISNQAGHRLDSSYARTLSYYYVRPEIELVGILILEFWWLWVLGGVSIAVLWKHVKRWRHVKQEAAQDSEASTLDGPPSLRD